MALCASFVAHGAHTRRKHELKAFYDLRNTKQMPRSLRMNGRCSQTIHTHNQPLFASTLVCLCSHAGDFDREGERERAVQSYAGLSARVCTVDTCVCSHATDSYCIQTVFCRQTGRPNTSDFRKVVEQSKLTDAQAVSSAHRAFLGANNTISPPQLLRNALVHSSFHAVTLFCIFCNYSRTSFHSFMQPVTPAWHRRRQRTGRGADCRLDGRLLPRLAKLWL